MSPRSNGSCITSDTWPYPRWIAHRGAGKLAPENTLAAFRLGTDYGFRMFECDVRVSRDGVAFLQHDASLLRTTGQRGFATHREWTDLARLDAGSWHSTRHAGEPIPSLASVARYCLANGLCLNVEIKATQRDGFASGSLIAHEISRYWALRPDLPLPLVTSFEPLALEGSQNCAPTLPRGILLAKKRRHWLTTALQLQCVAVIPHHELIDEKLVREAKEANLRVVAYTVNDPTEAQRLAKLGVDGLITDKVDQFMPDDWPGSADIRTRASV